MVGWHGHDGRPGIAGRTSRGRAVGWELRKRCTGRTLVERLCGVERRYFRQRVDCKCFLALVELQFFCLFAHPRLNVVFSAWIPRCASYLAHKARRCFIFPPANSPPGAQSSRRFLRWNCARVTSRGDLNFVRPAPQMDWTTSSLAVVARR